MQGLRQRLIILYSHSDFTPWKENVSACMLGKLIEAFKPHYDVSVAHFAGFNQEFAGLLKRFNLVFNICYGFDDYQQTDICKWLDDNDIPHTASNWHAQNLAQDKLMLPDLCAQAGLYSPRIFNYISQNTADLPLLVKPRFGSMHRDIVVYKNGDVPFYYYNNDNFLVQ